MNFSLLTKKASKMIDMIDKNQILLMYYRDGKSKRSISSSLQISRKTVRKCIEDHEAKTASPNLLANLEQGLSTKPKYDSSERKKRKLYKELEEEITSCLQKNKEKRNQGQHKQIMKKVDIYEYLISRGYQIGYTTICNYIRDREERERESFIKQIYAPGQTCEFDWAEAKITIAGHLYTFNLAVFTPAYSNLRWAKLFHRQDMLAFGQSHIDFFKYTGKVYKEMVYDNMRVAIKKFVGRTEKEPTETLLELSNYYKFMFRFCNIRKGNEKGHVERSVEYVRRKAFCVRDDFASLKEANAHLALICEQLNNQKQKLAENKTAIELFAEEKPHLYTSGVPYKCFAESHGKVDKYSTIIVQGNRYSVPDFLKGKLLDIKIFAEKIDIYLKNEFIWSHTRSYKAHDWIIEIEHYLTTLTHKPGALKGSVAFDRLSKDLKHIYYEYFNRDSKAFIEVLQYCKDNAIDYTCIKASIEELKKISPLSINKDTVVLFIDKIKNGRDTGKTTHSQEKETDEIAQYSYASLQSLSNMLK